MQKEKAPSLIVLAALLISTPAHSRCMTVKDRIGTFVIDKIENASFPCFQDEERNSIPLSKQPNFPFEGCFIDLKQAGKAQEILYLYDRGHNCTLKKGDKIKVHTHRADCCDRILDLTLVCRLQPRPEIISGPRNAEEVSCLAGRNIVVPDAPQK